MADRESGGRRSSLAMGPRVEAVLRLAYEARKPVLLEGPSGIGKSEIVGQAAGALGVGLAVLDLSLLEPPDLVGLPVIGEGVTRYACPSALPQAGAGILLLEELNRAERYVQQPALQLLTARRLHEYVLPEGWSVVAAINPEDGDYQVTPLDPALRSRFLQLRVRAERATWLAWARVNGVHTGVLRLALTHDRLLEDVSPRTWKHVSDLLWVLGRAPEAQGSALRDALGGYLPSIWVEALLATRSTWDLEPGLDVLRLLSGYAQDREAQALLAGYRREGRTDVLEAIAYRVEALLRDDGTMAALVARGELDLGAFERLLQDLPGDHAERLQEAFGASPWTGRLLEIEPDQVLGQYPGSAASRTVARWVAERLTRHRAWAFAKAVEHYLMQHPQLVALRVNPAARAGVAELVRQLGPEAAAPLLRTLRRLAVTLPAGGQSDER